jgi:hypothetical protein
MGANRKIVALVIALMVAMAPVSGVTCAHGTCHAHDDSSVMPCHGKHAHSMDEVLEAANDHSCCRILPVLPALSREQMTAPSTERRDLTPASELSQGATIVERPFEMFFPDSPPRCPTQSLSCVLLI